MYEILIVEELTPVTKMFEIRAPDVARKAKRPSSGSPWSKAPQ